MLNLWNVGPRHKTFFNVLNWIIKSDYSTNLFYFQRYEIMELLECWIWKAIVLHVQCTCICYWVSALRRCCPNWACWISRKDYWWSISRLTTEHGFFLALTLPGSSKDLGATVAPHPCAAPSELNLGVGHTTVSPPCAPTASLNYLLNVTGLVIIFCWQTAVTSRFIVRPRDSDDQWDD